MWSESLPVCVYVYISLESEQSDSGKVSRGRPCIANGARFYIRVVETRESRWERGPNSHCVRCELFIILQIDFVRTRANKRRGNMFQVNDRQEWCVFLGDAVISTAILREKNNFFILFICLTWRQLFTKSNYLRLITVKYFILLQYDECGGFINWQHLSVDNYF